MRLGALLLLVFLSGCSSLRTPLAVGLPRDTSATYTVTFTGTWSAASHPAEFPTSAHFSGLIGATHDDRVVFWRAGQLASPGIQAMAELGEKMPLMDEIDAALTAGTAQVLLSGDGIRPSPGRTSLEFRIAESHPLVTLVSMIAPSPDWFVGVADLPLRVEGRWVDSLTVALRGWDAGTDDGTFYTAANAPAMPHTPISALAGGPFEVNGEVPPLGTFTFVRHREDSPRF